MVRTSLTDRQFLLETTSRHIAEDPLVAQDKTRLTNRYCGPVVYYGIGSPTRLIVNQQCPEARGADTPADQSMELCRLVRLQTTASRSPQLCTPLMSGYFTQLRSGAWHAQRPNTHTRLSRRMNVNMSSRERENRKMSSIAEQQTRHQSSVSSAWLIGRLGAGAQ